MWKEHILLGCKVMVALLTLSPCIRACHVCPMSDVKGSHPCCNGTLVIPHLCCNILDLYYLIPFDLDFMGLVLCDIHFLLPEDFQEHSRLCKALLDHYHGQWLDRRVYWAARNRSIYDRDLVTLIVDSFDKSKLYLPKFPFSRTPKRTIYENCNRLWD